MVGMAWGQGARDEGETVRTAFKEWAAVCEALASGRQTILLRKGGIVEEGGAFKPSHSSFLLLPTYLHQSMDQLIPEAGPFFDRSLASAPKDGGIAITHWAEVAFSIPVNDASSLARLRAEHLWADHVIAERFMRWTKDLVHLMALRVWSLPQTVARAPSSHYAGCKSWIELDEDVDVDGSIPVLDDMSFDGRMSQLRLAFEGRRAEANGLS